MALPWDSIISFLDRNDLYHCLTVNQNVYLIVVAYLYERVSVGSPFEVYDMIDNHDSDEQPKYYNKFRSSRLPKHALYIKSFSVSGMLTDVDRLLPPLQHALSSYKNIKSFTWRPIICAEALTASMISFLDDKTTLTSLDISTAGLYTQEPTIPFSSLPNISNISVYSPRPYILRSLASSLESLPRPIRSLSLEGDCGNVFAGTLKSLIPSLSCADHFALGVSYSLKYEDILFFLERLPCLRSLRLLHYTQLAPLKRLPTLTNLTSLTLIYSSSHSPTTNGSRPKTSQATLNLFKWARRISTRSNGLKHFEISSDMDDNDSGDNYGEFEAPPRVDGFVGGYVTRIHSSTLQSLIIPNCYISKDVFYKLLDCCPNLESLKVTIRIEAFRILPEYVQQRNQPLSLRTFELHVTGGKKCRATRTELNSLCRSLLQNGKTSLRRVLANCYGFEGTWGPSLPDGDEKAEAVFQVIAVKAGLDVKR